MTFTKKVLSSSTNGMGIKVAATATLGTTIHTAVSGTAQFDEIWLWAYNSDTIAHSLTIEFGDATAPDHNIVVSLAPQQGAVLVVPGLLLQNALVVTAFADLTNKVTITGYVNNIS